MAQALATTLVRFRLTDAEPVAETAIARVFRARRDDGSHAALKIYSRADPGNERGGTAYLKAWAGRGTVDVLDETDEALAMVWLDGPSLGDIARAGDPDRADKLLASMAAKLHRPPPRCIPGLTPLATEISRLGTVRISPTASEPLRRDMARAASLAARLLDGQDSVPLHGDLHHDNVILTETGPQVIDAKGYAGDRAFELANALRNPRGTSEMLRNPDRHQARIRQFAAALNVAPARLAAWAAVKCAHSIALRAKGEVVDDPEGDLLALFLTETRQ